jgi:hypothetical protein
MSDARHDTTPPPAATYASRLASRRAEVERLVAASRRVADLRLPTFALGCGVGGAALAWEATSAVWMAVPALGFAALVVRHARLRSARSHAERAVAWYEWAVARLEGAWGGFGDPGGRYADPDHPYAQHLDVFGRRSVFQLLCTARTPAGRDTLAAWLTDPAGRAQVVERQEAVRDLAARIDLREDLGLLGAEVEEGCDADRLTAWGGAPPVLSGGVERVLAVVLPAVAVVSLLGWIFGDVSGWWFLAAVVAEVLLHRRLRRRVDAVVAGGEVSQRHLDLLGKLLARVESERFGAARLERLRAELSAEGEPPSVRIFRLRRLVELLDGEKNQLFAPVAALLLWRVQIAYAIEAWRARTGPALGTWQRVVGELEALAALATYAYERPTEPFPELVEEGPLIAGRELGHPLLPDADCVRNDVALDAGRQAYIVSGSNMSGKSTLLRTVGINAVLAFCGAPVRARSLRLAPLVVGASIQVADSLQDGESRFYAEVKRIGRIAGLARGGRRPLLFLLDEIFHGTNSHDRRIGAGAVLRELLDAGAVGLMTTHDLALARIADDLPGRVENVHFEDQLVDGRMSFDYRMRPGVVAKSNALELMRAVGLDV